MAIDITRPATLHIELVDAAGHPLPDASVSLTPSYALSAKPVSTVTDTAGNATLRQSGDALIWPDDLTIVKSGFIPLHTQITLFANADMDRRLRLNAAHTTVIALRTAAGRPAPHVPFNISYTFRDEHNQRAEANSFRDSVFRTDADGHYTLVHPAISGSFTLSIAGRRLRFPDSPRLSVTLTPDELHLLTPDVSLHAIFLLPDGSPAKDWLIAPQVDFRDAGGVISGGPTYALTVSRWQSLAADGSFNTDSPGHCLLLLSPEGLPLFYALDPQAWPTGVHSLRLTLPAIERTISGRFVDAQSQPLAHIPIFAGAMRASTWGSFRVTAPGVPSAAAVSGPLAGEVQPSQLRSDASGHFSIPLRWGANAMNWQAGVPWTGPSYIPRPQIGESDTITLIPQERNFHAPADLKDVILQFVGPDGQPLSPDAAPWIETLTTTANPTGNDGESPLVDRRGIHYFIRKSATAVHIETREEFWKHAAYTLPLTDAQEQVLSIHLLASQRNRPVTGAVRDAAGNPVPNVQISVFDNNMPKNRGTNGRRYFYHLGAITDADGRFTMPAAPDTCELSISREDPVTGEFDIPDTAPSAVAPDHRDIAITLPPAGAARILLSAGLVPAARSLSLRPEKAGSDDITSFPLYFDPGAHTLSTPPLAAGIYHIPPDALASIAHFNGLDIIIAPHQTTTIDLRAASILPPPTIHAAMVSVVAGGKAVAGAEVAIFTTPVPDDGVSLQPLALDLSDDNGQVYFSAPAGRPCIALARVRGRYAGFLEFTLPPGTSHALTLTLHPDATPTDSHDAIVKPNPAGSPESLKSRALKRLHHSDATWSTPGWYRMP